MSQKKKCQIIHYLTKKEVAKNLLSHNNKLGGDLINKKVYRILSRIQLIDMVAHNRYILYYLGCHHILVCHVCSWQYLYAYNLKMRKLSYSKEKKNIFIRNNSRTYKFVYVLKFRVIVSSSARPKS